MSGRNSQFIARRDKWGLEEKVSLHAAASHRIAEQSYSHHKRGIKGAADAQCSKKEKSQCLLSACPSNSQFLLWILQYSAQMAGEGSSRQRRSNQYLSHGFQVPHHDENRWWSSFQNHHRLLPRLYWILSVTANKRIGIVWWSFIQLQKRGVGEYLSINLQRSDEDSVFEDGQARIGADCDRLRRHPSEIVDAKHRKRQSIWDIKGAGAIFSEVQLVINEKVHPQRNRKTTVQLVQLR